MKIWTWYVHIKRDYARVFWKTTEVIEGKRGCVIIPAENVIIYYVSNYVGEV